MIKQLKIFVLILIGLMLQSGLLMAEDWPQWRGINRDGKSPETGLLKEWPEKGPELLKTITDIGIGYASPAVVQGKIYISGAKDEILYMQCFDMEGKKLWETPCGEEFVSQYPGSRATPTVTGDMLYIMTGMGHLAALRLSDGKKLWGADIVRKFKTEVPRWGYAESVLIQGNTLYCTPGGKNATFAAFNKDNGELIWTSKWVSDPADYSSIIFFEYDSIPLLATLTAKALVCVCAKDGRFFWRYTRPANTTANVPTPIYHDGYVFCASGYRTGGGAVKLKRHGDEVSATEAWETDDMNCHHGGFVLLDGYIYGNHGNGWSCIDLRSGKTMYTARGVGKGSVTYADGMLYTLSESGVMGLVPVTPKEHKIVSSFKMPYGPSPSWAHPVISEGKLFLRRHTSLYIYNIKSK